MAALGCVRRALPFALALCVLVAGVAAAGIARVDDQTALAAPAAPGPTESAVVVNVGGDRLANGSVAPLAGVQLKLTVKPVNAINPPFDLFCTSVADGTCTFTVASTNAANANATTVVRQVAPAANHFLSLNRFTTNTLETVSALLPYEIVGPTLVANKTFVSGVDFMLDTGVLAPSASGGTWAVSRTNPPLSKCGIDVALVADLSNSVTRDAADLLALKTAASGFVDVLNGASAASRVALFTFATNTPADNNIANAPALRPANDAGLKTDIASWQATDQPLGATNWDAVFRAVAAAGTTYDVVVMLTDGNPTVFGTTTVGGDGDHTRFREIEAAVFSANAIKATGKTRIVGVGVGLAPLAQVNLAAISGPTQSFDYFLPTDYAVAGKALADLATAGCSPTPTLTVVKLIGTPGNATVAPGWSIAVTQGGNPAGGGTTDVFGKVVVPIDPADTAGSITVGETPPATQQQPLILGSVQCISVADNAQILPTSVAATSFTLDPATFAGSLICSLYNRPPDPATVVPTKLWSVNGGAAVANGLQPAGISATALVNGTQVVFGQSFSLAQGAAYELSEQIADTNADCTVGAGRVVELNGAVVDLPLPLQRAALAGANTVTVLNPVTCSQRQTPPAGTFADPAPPAPERRGGPSNDGRCRFDPTNDPSRRFRDDPGPDGDSGCCRPGKICRISPPAGPDSRFSIAADGGSRYAVLEGTRRGGSRPDCRGYRERTTDWVEFRFRDSAAGADWRKTATMTTTTATSKKAAVALAKEIQICYGAPYRFPTRPGYAITRSDGGWVGVLADCTDAAVARGAATPCLSGRQVVRAAGGWVVKLIFEVPPRDEDPKAMG